ncbi:MAG: transglutaminase-like domain-containing protein [Actinomycetota bacterium]
MSTTTRARPADGRVLRTPSSEITPGQRWGVAVVAALPSLLVALAMPLVVEGTLSGFVYAPLVVLVAGVTAGLGPWIGLGAVAFGMGVGIAVGPGGYAPSSLLLSAGLAGSLLIGTWAGQALARGRLAVAAAIPSIALVVGVLSTGVTGTLEGGVLAAFTTLSITLLLILLGPWNGIDPVRPARWAEVLVVVTMAVASLATYAVSLGAEAITGDARTNNLFGRDVQESRTEGGVPDPFLVATRWQVDPNEQSRILFAIGTGPEILRNRPTWATFASYNGIAWIAPPTYGVSGDQIPVESVGAPTDTFESGTRVTVGVGLPGQWVPVPQRVDQVLSPVATRVDPAAGIVAAVSSPIDQAFDIRYSLAVAEAGQVREATPALSGDLDPAVAIPGPLGGPMASLAQTVEDEAGDNTWKRLVMLSELLRSPSLNAAPAQALSVGPPDRSYDGLNGVLAIGLGFQEQYAAIWAIIARSWGVPTRLVIGWPLDEAAQAGVATVTAGQVSIWPEARLEGLGWVAFQPSPQDRDAARPAVVKPLTQADLPVKPEPEPDPSASGQGGPDADSGGDQQQGDSAAEEQQLAIPWSVVIPAIIALAGLAWLVYVAVRRRRIGSRLRQGDAREQVLGAWTWARLLLAEAWIPLPLWYAPAADADYPEDMPDDVAWSVVTLARLAGPAIYGASPPDEAIVVEAWRGSATVGRTIGAATGWRIRLRRLLVPLDPTNVAAPRSSAPARLPA